MAKNDNSFLGSIFKGAIDLTAGTIKFAYDAAEEITKAGYKAATSDSAKKYTKVLEKLLEAYLDFLLLKKN